MIRTDCTMPNCSHLPHRHLEPALSAARERAREHAEAHDHIVRVHGPGENGVDEHHTPDGDRITDDERALRLVTEQEQAHRASE